MNSHMASSRLAAPARRRLQQDSSRRYHSSFSSLLVQCDLAVLITLSRHLMDQITPLEQNAFSDFRATEPWSVEETESEAMRDIHGYNNCVHKVLSSKERS